MAQIDRLLVCISVIVLSCGCSIVPKEWKEAQERDSVYSYEAYLREHPDSKFTVQAESRIAQLRKEEQDLSDAIWFLLSSRKVRNVSVVDEDATPRPGNVWPARVSGRENEVLACVPQEFRTADSGGLTLKVHLAICYVPIVGGFVSGDSATHGVYVTTVSVDCLLCGDAKEYSLADCRNPQVQDLLRKVEVVYKDRPR